jgi:hypothetical protein
MGQSETPMDQWFQRSRQFGLKAMIGLAVISFIFLATLTVTVLARDPARLQFEIENLGLKYTYEGRSAEPVIAPKGDVPSVEDQSDR